MSDSDYLFALQLQKQLNEEDSELEEVTYQVPAAPKLVDIKKPLKRSNPRSNLDEEFLNRTQNLVHPEWETLDPTPNIFAMFSNFDQKFFKGKLKCVTLEWSKRMYSCAGICYYQCNKYGKAITVRLSEPLLKLRPRKNLVETMLHEMIHAYCFVLNIREGNGGHGPNFKKIMQAINRVAGTNITVYHTFHDEVQHYLQFWWRCNGVCQNRSPFYGFVKRSSNRAPSANDQWWSEHLRTCGGTFLKIKGPDLEKKGKQKKRAAGGADIRKFFNNNSFGENSSKPKEGSNSITTQKINGFGSSVNGPKGPLKSNGGGTIVVNPKPKPNTNTTVNAEISSIAKSFPPTSYPGLSNDPFNVSKPQTTNINRTATATVISPRGNLNNVTSLRDLTGDSEGTTKMPKPQPTMDGRGYSFDSEISSHRHVSNSGRVDRDHLREVWLKRFGDTKVLVAESDQIVSPTACTNDKMTGDSKRRKTTADGDFVTIDEEKEKDVWTYYDNDVQVKLPSSKIIEISDSSDSEDDTVEVPIPQIRKGLTADERQVLIKQEILNETSNLDETDIILIDDEFDDNFTVATELADTSVIDEFFDEDTLLKEFNLQNDVIPTGSRYKHNKNDDIITCPICQFKMKRSVLNEHLDGCSGITEKMTFPVKKLGNSVANTRELKPKRKSRAPKQTKKDLLRMAGYTEEDLANIVLSENSDDAVSLSDTTPPANSSTYDALDDSFENSRSYRQRNLLKTTRQCPKCGLEFEEDFLITHLRKCK